MLSGLIWKKALKQNIRDVENGQVQGLDSEWVKTQPMYKYKLWKIFRNSEELVTVIKKWRDILAALLSKYEKLRSESMLLHTTV